MDDWGEERERLSRQVSREEICLDGCLAIRIGLREG